MRSSCAVPKSRLGARGEDARDGIGKTFLSAREKARRGEPLSGTSRSEKFLCPYYQNTKLTNKSCQRCWGVLAGKWFVLLGHYFGFVGWGLTSFAD